jgi:hypothetical protein
MRSPATIESFNSKGIDPCFMKKSTAALTLLLSVTLIAASHLETQTVDGKTIFLIDSVYVDLLGYGHEKATEWLNLATSRCKRIDSVAPKSQDYEIALQAVQQYSPPDSESAQLVQLARDGEWFWAEVTFAKLEPAVLLLARTPTDLAIWDAAVWSGPTHPWSAKNTIEQYLKTKSPPTSHRLLDCAHPSPGVF